LEDGASANKVNLFLVKTDTLLPGQWPWSPKIDSTIYRIVCYVTDDNNRLDVSFNGPVDINIEFDGEGTPDQYSINLQQGGVVFDYHPSGSSGATITATVEGVGTAVLYIEGVTGIAENEGHNVLQEFVLKNNYPNPFDQSTTIEYVLPENTHIKLAVYNVQGELLEILVDDQKSAGQYSVIWNADHYPAGVYFYIMGSEQSSITKKCMILK
jgi:hypothetical protein